VATVSKKERRFIKDKEAKKLLSEFYERIKIDSRRFSTLKPHIELVKANDVEIFFVSKKPIFVKSSGKLFPTLTTDKLLASMPKAVVNMGAVPHVCNGADIMAPGIVHFEGAFNKEDIVIISDERHQKPIAIAAALYSSEEAKKLEHGKVLKNLHYVGDKVWNTMKKLK